jgi:prepilin-type N-terminal cleavage/methylation domain-containing protein/prepilin-type processing-associated H-X9-DG protein
VFAGLCFIIQMLNYRKNQPNISEMCVKTGFTLVELLVVIAIIALLVAILVPVLQAAREDAKTVVCSSNIKQLLIALTSYETQNGTFPYSTWNSTPPTIPPGGYPGNQYDKQCWWWFHFIADYWGKDRNRQSILWCPSRRIKEAGAKPNILLGNYGVNQAICKNFIGNPQVDIPLRMNQIPQPSQTVLVMDSGYSTLTWCHATDSPPYILQNSGIDSGYVPGLYKVNKDRLSHFRPGVDFTFDALTGRHPNKIVNTGFVDGHVTRPKADDFYVEKVGSDYKNRSPLWLPTP